MKRLISLLLTLTLCAALALPVLAEGRYTDVPETAAYAVDAEYCAQQGLMLGVGDGRFDPETRVTRAMVVTVLHRMAGSPAVETVGADFSDVAPEAWYAQAVAWAAAHQITLGTAEGVFSPEQQVTWGQVMTFLWRYAGQPDAEETPEDGAPWYVPAALWLRSAGLLDRMGFQALSADGPVTRSQLVTAIARFAQSGSLDVDCAPCGILVTEDGSLIVTDTNRKLLWNVDDRFRQVYAGGVSVLGLYGEPLGGYNDGTLAESLFGQPWAIAPFLDGYAVSDASNNAIRLVRSETVETVNGATRENLTVTNMGVVFARPTGLATDSKGNLYVSDTLNNAVRKITPKGDVSTVARDLNDPMGLCWAEGSLYIAETGGNRILKLSGTELTVVAGSGEADYADGKAAEAAFCAPQGVAVDSDGTVYVADTGNGAVRRIRDGAVDTVLSRDWSDQSFFPVSPIGLALRDGKLYVCDNFSCKILIVNLAAQ